MLDFDKPLWVFAYGSLIWNPGFEFVDKKPATVFGYHRALCLASHEHRGTKDIPGLVLALDKGGCCKGIAYKVAQEHTREAVSYLRARELVTNAYLERIVSMRMRHHSGSIPALTYVIDKKHSQYDGGLNHEECAARVARAVGTSGPNPDYVFNSLKAFEEFGIKDKQLLKVADHLRELS